MLKNVLILVCVPLLYCSFNTSCWSWQCDHQGFNEQKKTGVWITVNSKLVRFHCIHFVYLLKANNIKEPNQKCIDFFILQHVTMLTININVIYFLMQNNKNTEYKSSRLDIWTWQQLTESLNVHGTINGKYEGILVAWRRDTLTKQMERKLAEHWTTSWEYKQCIWSRS
jgi:hypothetical protein